MLMSQDGRIISNITACLFAGAYLLKTTVQKKKKEEEEANKRKYSEITGQGKMVTAQEQEISRKLVDHKVSDS